MKKWVILWTIGVFMAFVVAAAIQMAGPGIPEDLDVSARKLSQNGLYIVTIQPEISELQRGPEHNWIVFVQDRSGEPVENAGIIVQGRMPQHDAHNFPGSPQTSGHLGEGRYLVEGVRFDREGWWELKFGIEADAGIDLAAFNLVL
jgi:hypothetical protein